MPSLQPHLPHEYVTMAALQDVLALLQRSSDRIDQQQLEISQLKEITSDATRLQLTNQAVEACMPRLDSLEKMHIELESKVDMMCSDLASKHPQDCDRRNKIICAGNAQEEDVSTSQPVTETGQKSTEMQRGNDQTVALESQHRIGSSSSRLVNGTPTEAQADMHDVHPSGTTKGRLDIMKTPKGSQQVLVTQKERRKNAKVLREYCWRESLWDVSIFIGTSAVSFEVSISIAVCLFFHCLLTLGLMKIMGTALTKSDINEDSLREFEYWRSTTSHDVIYQDKVTGESLASSVCNMRLYLPSSSLQLDYVQLLSDYTAPAFYFGIEFMSGKATCFLVLCVWYLSVFVELRNMQELFSCCFDIPILPATGFVQDPHDTFKRKLVSISRVRVVWFILILALRLGVAITVCVFGILFLIHETSLEDMLLNAVAMEFTLKLDALIFAALLPRRAQFIINRISTFRYRVKCTTCTASGSLIMNFIFLFGASFVVSGILLEPFATQLINNLEALCGGVEGTLDFVVGVDSLGIPWAASTPGAQRYKYTYTHHAILQVHKNSSAMFAGPLVGEQRHSQGVLMKVSSASELERRMATSPEFLGSSNWNLFSMESGMPETSSSQPGWDELPVLRDADPGDATGTVYNNYLRYLLGTEGSASCAQVPDEMCSNLGDSQDHVLMQHLCPGRCGCDSPTTGTVSTPFSDTDSYGSVGCADWNLRRQRAVRELQELPCEDTDSLDVFTSWVQGVGKAVNDDGALKGQFAEAFKSGGCKEVVRIKIGTGAMARSDMCTESSLPAICPMSCGCEATADSWEAFHADRFEFCPYKCARGIRHCLTIARNHTEVSITGPKVGYACRFPFEYGGRTYNNCTSAAWSGPWCYIVPVTAKTTYWGDCPEGC